MKGKEEMVDLEELRYLALSFPDTTEEEHHDRPAFRVAGKIFATLPDDEHINVLLDAEAAHIATVITPSAARNCGGVNAWRALPCAWPMPNWTCWPPP